MNDRPADTPPDRTAPDQPYRTTITLRLEAVGREWDGTLTPVNLVTYTPPPRG